MITLAELKYHFLLGVEFAIRVGIGYSIVSALLLIVGHVSDLVNSRR